MKGPRRKTLSPPRNAWEATLEEADAADRSQAGEIEPGDEERGGGDKGLDAETGDGGYGGDAVEAGSDESRAQSDRPLDREMQGDPRTHEGNAYPDDARSLDSNEGSIGRESIDEGGIGAEGEVRDDDDERHIPL